MILQKLCVLVLVSLLVGQIFGLDSITELAAYRNRRGFKSRLDNLLPTAYSGKCITSPKSGRDICYPDISSLDYSCVSKNQNGHKSVPPPRVQHAQYKALITKFRAGFLHVPATFSHETTLQPPIFKPFLVVQYECHQGYTFLDEAEFLFCREYRWHETPPVCVPSDHVKQYRQLANPCQQENGGCSHICKHLGQNVTVCECPSGFEMQDDLKTCIEQDACQKNNGGCSQLCDVTDDGASVCSCLPGFELKDHKICVESLLTDMSMRAKLGLCPQVPFGHPDQQCASNCRVDDDCRASMKCCSNGCASICLDPEPGTEQISRPITECSSTEGCKCLVLDESRQRCTCQNNAECYLTRSAPEVVVEPRGHVQVPPGSSLNLSCSVTGFPAPNVTWQRDGKSMEQQQQPMVALVGGATSLPGSKTTTKRLVIKELFKSTVFSCEAHNDMGSDAEDIEVIVTGPGSPPMNVQSKVQGTSVFLRWLPPTLPNGRMTGYKIMFVPNDHKKPQRLWNTTGSTDPKVFIHDLEPKTKYFFRIIPFNERGAGVKSSIFSVTTDRKDVLPIVEVLEGDVIELEPGESVNLTCKVKVGYPAPQLAWFHHDNRIGQFTVVDSLEHTVENVVESTSFECRATNAKGSSNASVKIEVMGPGGAPGQIQHRVDGVDVELSWGSPAFPNGQIKGYALFYTMDDKKPIVEWTAELIHFKQTIVLKKLQPKTTYYAAVKAFNEKGPGPLSATFTFITDLENFPPKVRLVAPTVSQVLVKPGGSVNLTCTSSGVPEPTLNWKQDGEVMRAFGSRLNIAGAKSDGAKTTFIQRLVESTSFSCEAVNHLGSDSARVDVLVTGPGSSPENIEVTSREREISVQWQEPLITNGQINGYTIYISTNQSLPLEEWQKIDVPTIGHQTSHVIQNLVEEETYFVRMAAYSTLGEGVLSQPYQIKTKRKLQPPSVSLVPAQKFVTLRLDGKYTVTCKADGYPQPKLVWYRDGVPVGFRTLSDGANSISAVLTVEALLRPSLFQCKAENPLGLSTAEVRIDVLGPGSSPLAVKFLPYSTNIELQWEPPEIPNGEITGYDVIYTTNALLPEDDWENLPVGPGREVRVVDLRPQTRYTLKIRAKNSKGHGPFTPSFEVTTGMPESKPQIRLSPDKTYLPVAPGSTINITCAADGFPEPYVYWSENRHKVAHEPAAEVTFLRQDVREPTMLECRAINELGDVSVQIKVDVMGPGQAPMRFMGVAKGISIHLSWVSPRIKNGHLQSFIIHQSIDASLEIEKWKQTFVPIKKDPISPFYDLTLPKLQPLTQYHFRAQAISEKGPGILSSPISIKTEEQDYFISVSVEPAESVEIGIVEKVELRCLGTGFPEPTVVWKEKDLPVTTPGPNVSTFLFSFDKGYVPTSLECYGSSAAGTAIKTVHIMPSGPHSPPDEVRLSAHGNEMTVSWKPPKTPNGEITAYTIAYIHKPEEPIQNWSEAKVLGWANKIVLPRLTPHSTYAVKVRAQNGQSFGPWSEQETIQTGPELTPAKAVITPIKPVQDVVPGTSFNLTCIGQGFPEPEVVLMKNDQNVTMYSKNTVTYLQNQAVESATYECRAKNSLGTNTTRIYINVTGPGEPPKNIVAKTRGLTIMIDWSPPNITNGRLTEFLIYYTSDNNETLPTWDTISAKLKPNEPVQPRYEVAIPYLERLTEYFFKIQAISENGPGIVSKEVAATTEEEDYSISAIVEPLERLEVPKNGAAELKCFGRGYPRIMKAEWSKDNETIAEGANFSSIMPDGITSAVILECKATNEAGTAKKSIQLVPNDVMKTACVPKSNLLDGKLVVTWSAIDAAFKPQSNYTLFYTNNVELSLDSWNRLTVINPEKAVLPNLLPNQKYYLRLSIADVTTKAWVICETSTVSSPSLPQQVTILRTKNKTVINWGRMDIPDKKIEKIFVYYTYEIGKPFDQWDNIVVPPTAEEVTINGIKPSTNYLIKMEFITDKGEKIYSVQYAITSPDFQYTKCELARCEQSCFHDASSDTATCQCSIGYTLNSNDNRTCLEFGRSVSCSIRNGGCDQICIDPIIKSTTVHPKLSAAGKSQTRRRQVTVAVSPEPMVMQKTAPKTMALLEPSEETLSSVVKPNDDFDIPGEEENWRNFPDDDQGFVTCQCNPDNQLQEDGFSCKLKPITSTVATIVVTVAILEQPEANPICLLPLSIGQCDQDKPVWYYDGSIDSCYVFSYTGCGGNLNRFESRSTCMSTCSKKPCYRAVSQLYPNVPTCNDDTGFFTPLQCDISGECWCVNIDSGQEINGTRLKVQYGRPHCIACKQESDRPVEPGDTVAYRPECTDDGHFATVQCHHAINECWCVDQLSGLEVSEVRVDTASVATLECLRPELGVKPQGFRVGMLPSGRLRYVFEWPEGEPTGLKKIVIYYVDGIPDPEKPVQWSYVEIDRPFKVDGFEIPSLFASNKTYTLRIAAVIGSTLVTPTESVQLFTSPNVPPQPPELTVDLILPNRADLSWPRHPEIDRPMFNQYNVYVEDLNSLSEKVITNILAIDRLSVPLMPNTVYSLSIAAVGPQSVGPKSNTVVISTPGIIETVTLKPAEKWTKQPRRFIPRPTLQPEVARTPQEPDAGQLQLLATTRKTDLRPEIGSTPTVQPETDEFDGATYERMVITEPTVQPVDRVSGAVEWSKIAGKCSILHEQDLQVDLLIIGDSQSFHGSTMQQLYTMALQDLVHSLNGHQLKPHFLIAFLPIDRYERQIVLLNGSQSIDRHLSIDNLFTSNNTKSDDVTDLNEIANSALDEVTVALKDRRYIRRGARQMALAITAVTTGPNSIDWLGLSDAIVGQKRRLNLGVRYLAIGSGTLEKNSERWATETIGVLCDTARTIRPLQDFQPGSSTETSTVSTSITRIIGMLEPKIRPTVEATVYPSTTVEPGSIGKVVITHALFISATTVLLTWTTANLTPEITHFRLDYNTVGTSLIARTTVIAKTDINALIPYMPRGEAIIFRLTPMIEEMMLISGADEHLLLPELESASVQPATTLSTASPTMTIFQPAEFKTTPKPVSTTHAITGKVHITNAMFTQYNNVHVEWRLDNLPDIGGLHLTYSFLDQPNLSGTLVISRTDTSVNIPNLPATTMTLELTPIVHGDLVSSASDRFTLVPTHLTTTSSYTSDIETYSQFSTTIPPDRIKIAPKCNCTCQMTMKLKRRRCYYEGTENQHQTGDEYGQEEVEVDLDRLLQNEKTKNCSGRITSQEHHYPMEPVPTEKESECPCVMPLQGDRCPPGFSLKFGKCRDINECAYQNGGCSDGCVNTMGSFYCACPPPMYRDLTNAKNCLGQDSYFKQLNRLLYHHLWNRLNASSSNYGQKTSNSTLFGPKVTAELESRSNEGQGNSKNRATAYLVDENDQNRAVRLEWEWAQRRKRRHQRSNG